MQSLANLSNLTKKQLIFLAQTANNIQRTQQALQFILEAIKIQPNLNIEQKQLFKSILDTEQINTKMSRRSSRYLQKVDSFGIKKQQRQQIFKRTIKIYKQKSSQYLQKVIQVLSDETILKKILFLQTQLFYQMILANSYGLYYECNQQEKKIRGQVQNEKINQSYSFKQRKVQYSKKVLKIYQQVYKKSKQLLQPTNPLALLIAFNFSNFYYSLDNNNQGNKIGKEAFDYFIGDLDIMQQDYYQDSSKLAQKIRDNLTLYLTCCCDDQD